VRFDLATPARTLFGSGTVAEIGPAARDLGRRALVVVGRAIDRTGRLLEILHGHGVDSVLFSVAGEPSVETVRQGTSLARAESCNLVIACGGGSAIDAGKAVAALLRNGGDPLDYLEVVGRGRPLARPSAPFLAVPTTAGTGSEVTRNAVLASPEHRVKASLRSPYLLPRLAVVDPDLLAGLPSPVVAASGLDAMAQLIEPLVSNRANPLTDGICREGLARSIRSLQRAFQGDRSESVREDLAMASLCGGLALANAGLGAIHGLAAPIGGMFDAPHGAVCAALLPAVVETNVLALNARLPESQALLRYREIALLLTGRRESDGLEAAARLRALTRSLDIAGLSRWGVTRADVEALVAKGKTASSMRANPIALTDEELAGILVRSL
jgi:alcohol dehydrogenase class IV